MTKRIRHLTLFVLFLSSCHLGIAQSEGNLRAVVKDQRGAPVEGVTITVKETGEKLTTDREGLFVIPKIDVGHTLVLTSVNYSLREVPYRGETELAIILDDHTQQLEDVVVIGYGQIRKGDETGALTQIKTDPKTKGFAPQAQDLLVGKVAGVSVINEGGSPSGRSFIRIRGGSSLTASNDPLIVVDGVFIENQGINGAGNILSTINPADIESFTILKDASATAIYGSRASNGVILITTKKGSGDRVQIMYDANASVGTLTNKIDVLTGDEFRVFLQERFGDQSIYDRMKDRQGLVNTDWQDVIFRNTVNTDHNLSIYGAMKNVLPYRVSVGYTNIDGVLKTSNSERFTGNFTLNPDLFDSHLKINLQGRGMYVNNRFADWGAIGAALAMDPSQSVYDRNSPYGEFFTWTGVDNTIIQVATKNPLSLLEMSRDQSDVYNFIGNSQLDYKVHFIPDLHLHANVGLDYSKSDGIKHISEFSPSDYVYGGYDSSWEEERRNSSLDLYAQYSKKLDFLKSNFDIMGGYAWQHYWRSGNNIGHRIARFDEFGDPLLVTRGNFATEHYILSFYGRVNYNIDNRYLMTFTLRQDGSSRFHRDNRWAQFPSAAFAWKISEEKFLRDSKWVDNLKLRLGWGKTGQQEINQGDYPYLATYLHSIGDQANYLRGYNNGVPIWVSLLRPEAYNQNLKWESTTTYNVGLDYELFDQRISGGLDVYHRQTNDLINAETKTTAGTNFKEFVAANIGNLENTGFEFSANGNVIKKADWIWDIGMNLGYNRNKITRLSMGDDKNTLVRNGVNAHRVGYAANMYYVYEQVYGTDGKPIEGLYIDQNNDGQINEQDLRPYHNPVADFTMGLNTRLQWRDWDFSISGHGSLGNYNYNAIAANNAALSPSTIYQNESLINRVSSALETNFQLAQPLSDYYVQNASFFRIDNINLGRSFKKGPKMPVACRVYGTVQNPFVFSAYEGLDPEVFGGYDGVLYPRPTMYLIGVNINF